MRLFFALFSGLILSVTAWGQTGSDPEQVAKQVINTGMIQGWDEKVLVHLGDAGAVLATKVLSNKNLTSETVSGTLIVIQNSFADPSLVEVAADREPRTSLLLLRYLELSVSDTKSRDNIADTRKYIQSRYAAFLKATER